MDEARMRMEVSDELTLNILPFWMTTMKDREQGGYYGRVTGENILLKDAPKGGILHARILWTFSSAALHLKSDLYLAEARRAKEYIFRYFFDEVHGGTYWMLHADGSPADTKKQVYSQAFFIYALTEYYRASGDVDALSRAKELYALIEQHSFDSINNGYLEAYSREWLLLDDLRLSDKDANEKKTMNTHLHVLEAYTSLYRVWRDDQLAVQLRRLILLFLDTIIDRKTGHLGLFFDEEWQLKSNSISYGHGIEAAWLLDEAAEVLGDEALLLRVRMTTLQMADAASEGFLISGGLMNEKNEATGHLDTHCDWWPQAESMVGFYNAYQHTGRHEYRAIAFRSWEFIKQYLIDTIDGEWFWSVDAEGERDTQNDKAGFWKCPYHNGRMCLELMTRINS